MLEEARKKIDDIDAQIIKLLADRCQITREIGTFKKEIKTETVDPGREQTMMDRYATISEENGISAQLVQNIFREILKLSYHSQQ